MSKILPVVLAVALVLVAGYLMAYQQTASHDVDVRASEVTAPIDAGDALPYAELTWYTNTLENLGIEAYARGRTRGEVRLVMHGALDGMWALARAEADTSRCDHVQCNPRLCAPWCPTMEKQLRGE